MARGKGLYRRGAVWWIRYAGLDGKIRYESSRTSNYKKAEALLTDRRKNVQEGKEPNPIKKIGIYTFKELAENYLKWAERQRSFPSKKGFVQLLVDHFGNFPLRRITTHSVEEYQSMFLAAGKKPATANRHTATLKHMVTKAVEWELVEEEALKRVRRVKQLEENNRRLRYLSRDEVQILVDSCKPTIRPIVITGLHSVMRKEEILSLEWDKHIDLVHSFILLDKTKNGERRQIPINETLRSCLQGIVRRLDSPYVFVDRQGKRYRDIKSAFNSATRIAGIKDFRFHDLRHTFASHLVMAGTDITTVKELLGHKTLTMTLRYSHLAPAHKAAAISRLDDSLRAEPNYTKTIQSMKKGSDVSA